MAQPLAAPARPVSLDSPIRDVPGIGPARAAQLARLGIASVRDLLLHLPMRYEDWRHPIPIKDAAPPGPVCVRASVRSVRVSGWGRRANVSATLADDSGTIEARWFSQGYLAQTLREIKQPHLFFGPVREHKGALQLANPRLAPRAQTAAGEPAALVPVYPATEGLTVSTLRRLIATALAAASESMPEVLPAQVLGRLALPSTAEAIGALHTPRNPEDVERARRRLALEELLVLQLALGLEKRRRQSAQAQPIEDREALERTQRALGLRATEAQRRAMAQISADLASGRPMARLLQGDVGSGKTLVALASMVSACQAGLQCAFMAPTEVLAEQHFLSIERVAARLGIETLLVTGRGTAPERARARERLAADRPLVAIGTHALLGASVQFARLGLVVIDEQHRFGVLQRDALLGKGSTPHLLVMTATPIPRTLTLALYGDLDVTTIDGSPADRREVRTVVVARSQLDAVWRAVHRAVRAGHQAFVVCPLLGDGMASERGPAREGHGGAGRARTPGHPAVDDGGRDGATARAAAPANDRADPGCAAVTPVAGELAGGPPPDDAGACERADVTRLAHELLSGPLSGVRVAALWGPMASHDKKEIMERLRAGSIDVLVGTPVIEVGVDVPNATVMVVMDAESFGLSQLHQLRGRIGRGSAAGTCYLVARTRDVEARRRLAMLAATRDGLEIATQDALRRGPGEIFGLNQSGPIDLRVADPFGQLDLLLLAREEAARLLAEDPRLERPENAALGAIARERALRLH